MDIIKIQTIKAGETLTHTGPVEVLGDIESGATIKIKEGGLTVHGNVGANVRIKVEAAPHSICFNNVTITSDAIRNGGRVILDGVDVTARMKQQHSDVNLANIHIKGRVSHNVTLVSNSNVILEQDAADSLAIYAENNITAQNIGHHTTLESDNNIIAGNIGNHAVIICDNNLEAQDVGALAEIEVDNNTAINCLGRESKLTGDNNVSIKFVDENCQVYADNNLTVNEAYASAKLEADNKKRVKKIIGGSPEKPSRKNDRRQRFNF